MAPQKRERRRERRQSWGNKSLSLKSFLTHDGRYLDLTWCWTWTFGDKLLLELQHINWAYALICHRPLNKTQVSRKFYCCPMAVSSKFTSRTISKRLRNFGFNLLVINTTTSNKWTAPKLRVLKSIRIWKQAVFAWCPRTQRDKLFVRVRKLINFHVCREQKEK